jgi:hypothetical protein
MIVRVLRQAQAANAGPVAVAAAIRRSSRPSSGADGRFSPILIFLGFRSHLAALAILDPG